MKFTDLVVLALAGSFYTSFVASQDAERDAVACEDTKPKVDCEFMLENGWCTEDMEYLKKKCDYTCGWCTEDKQCVDRADYIDCKKISQAKCLKNIQFYASRCRKSCKWCNALPEGLWKAWSPWTVCLATCGAGIRMRSRKCAIQPCKGKSVDVVPCEIKKCPTWTDWSSWSKCNGSCGSGVQTRSRICPTIDTCAGDPIQTQSCVLPPCAVKGVVFEKWTACSRSCGGGTRKKISSCSASDPTNCPHHFEDCNTHNCSPKKCFEYRYGSDQTACCSDRTGQCVRARRRIIGGIIAKPKQFAWMARLEYLTGRVGVFQRRLLCGGTLIHPMFVLTAAHCLEGVTPDRLQVLLGAISRYDTSTLTQRKSVENITMHPDYNTATLQNDIALIKLKSGAAMTSYVRTLCLPENEDPIIDTSCFVAGWGLTDPNVRLTSRNLLEAKVRHLPFKICVDGHKASPYGPHMRERSAMCAGVISGGFDTCRGDSGGPIMCQRCSSCSWYIAGITSFGAVQCGVANVPGVYTRVSYYEKWIHEIVKKQNQLGIVCRDV